MSLNKGIEVQMAHRRQWENITGGFTTSFVAANFQLGNLKSDFGLSFLNDVEGIGVLTTCSWKTRICS